MSYLERFLHDPLPTPIMPVCDYMPRYDYTGPAVWIGLDGRPVCGHYNVTPVPLLPLTPSELEALAQELFTTWGDPNIEPEYSTRHPEYNGRHNLIIYGSPIKVD